MNTDWHDAHVLGSHAPMEERVKWHLQHQSKCGCRPIPTDVQHAIDAQAHQGAST